MWNKIERIWMVFMPYSTVFPPQSTIQINPQHACALTILVTSGLEMSWTTNAFKFSVDRKREKCLSLSWNHISTSGMGQAEHLTPKERRERERGGRGRDSPSIHSTLLWIFKPFEQIFHKTWHEFYDNWDHFCRAFLWRSLGTTWQIHKLGSEIYI